MKVKLLGVRETQGTFEGKSFHSVKLHIAEPFTVDNSWGSETSVQSVKYDLIPFIFGKPVEVRDIGGLVGCDIDVQFDKNGTVFKIDIDTVM